MSVEYTDSMTMLDMLVASEEYQIRRYHSKNSRDEDWPSGPEITELAIEKINGYTNVELLEKMDEVLTDRREQRKRRETL